MSRKIVIDKHSKRTFAIPGPTYEMIHDLIFSTLRERGEVTFIELLDLVIQHKALNERSSAVWYFLTVKRDLEARGEIKVSMMPGPDRLQTITLVKKKGRPRNNAAHV